MHYCPVGEYTLSSARERSLHTGEVVGSIPTAPTIPRRQINYLQINNHECACRHRHLHAEQSMNSRAETCKIRAVCSQCVRARLTKTDRGLERPARKTLPLSTALVYFLAMALNELRKLGERCRAVQGPGYIRMPLLSCLKLYIAVFELVPDDVPAASTNDEPVVIRAGV